MSARSLVRTLQAYSTASPVFMTMMSVMFFPSASLVAQKRGFAI